MIDWTKSMSQTFEYYTVDPTTWRDQTRLYNVISSSIDRDKEADTLGSATFELSDEIGECYIRVYLSVNQNGEKEKVPLGTFLNQTPRLSYNGHYRKLSIDAYTPLLELKENYPPLGYSLSKGFNVMEYGYKLVRENTRAPVIASGSSKTLFSDFVANTDDTWLSYISSLITADKKELALDELSRIMFVPTQETSRLQAVWEYTDDNSSILYPDISLEEDMYGIPNVVEVIYSGSTVNLYSKAVNDDENSPTSIQSRGRQITHRVTNPDFGAEPTQGQLDLYAQETLKSLSTIKRTISYSHGYCPVRLGDCVRLRYRRAGFDGIKAQVIKQTIDCSVGCKVTETAVYSKNLWRSQYE